MRSTIAIAALTLLAAGSAVAGRAQAPAPAAAQPQQPTHPAAQASPAYKREVPRRLLARTKISEDSARAIALARMPGAAVQALELENEHGHLIWSWELKLAGKTGIEEVNVDALDGHVVGVEHEEQ